MPRPPPDVAVVGAGQMRQRLAFDVACGGGLRIEPVTSLRDGGAVAGAETFVEAARIGAAARRLQSRLTKWQPVAAKRPTDAIRTWLLTRTQYRGRANKQRCGKQAFKCRAAFREYVACVSLRLQFARLARQKRHKADGNRDSRGLIRRSPALVSLTMYLRAVARTERQHHLAALGKLGDRARGTFSAAAA